MYKRFSRLRSVSSYPDLRNREFETDERWRFYDDTRVSECRYEASDPIYQNQEDGVDVGGGKLRSDTEKVEVVEPATAEVVEEISASSNPAPPPSAPPSPPPPPPPTSKPGKRRTKRVYHDVAPKEEKERADFTPPPPPPINTIPPPPTTVYRKSSKRRRRNAEQPQPRSF